jgi:hypothetical protein
MSATAKRPSGRGTSIGETDNVESNLRRAGDTRGGRDGDDDCAAGMEDEEAATET